MNSPEAGRPRLLTCNELIALDKQANWDLKGGAAKNLKKLKQGFNRRMQQPN